MKKTIYIACMCLLGITACKKDDNTAPSSMSQQDRDFMQKASYANYNETDEGQVVVMKSHSIVATYAGMMVADHLDMENHLRYVAQNKDLTLPFVSDDAHVVLDANLAAMSGRAYDSAYLHMQSTDHQAAIDLMQNEITGGTDADVKGYAAMYLPKVIMHKKMADSLIATLNY